MRHVLLRLALAFGVGGLFASLFLISSSLFPISAAVFFVHSDHLGSTTLITDESGAAVDQEVYFPYGTSRASLSTVHGLLPTERSYTSQNSDLPATGLYYYHARYYSPTLGKFTQADTVADGLNKYAYVGNNPINAIDPSGNYTAPCTNIPSEALKQCLDSVSPWSSSKEASTWDVIKMGGVVNLTVIISGVLNVALPPIISSISQSAITMAQEVTLYTKLGIAQSMASRRIFNILNSNINYNPNLMIKILKPNPELVKLAELNRIDPVAAESAINDFMISKGIQIQYANSLGRAQGLADIVERNIIMVKTGFLAADNSIKLHELSHLSERIMKTGAAAIQHGFPNELRANLIELVSGSFSRIIDNSLISSTLYYPQTSFFRMITDILTGR